MSLQWRAKCDRPLVGFLLGYTINSCISLVLHVYFYRQLKDGVAFPFEPRWKRFLGKYEEGMAMLPYGHSVVSRMPRMWLTDFSCCRALSW